MGEEKGTFKNKELSFVTHLIKKGAVEVTITGQRTKLQARMVGASIAKSSRYFFVGFRFKF